MDLYFINAVFWLMWQIGGFFMLLYRFTSLMSYIKNIYNFCSTCFNRITLFYKKSTNYMKQKYKKVNQVNTDNYYEHYLYNIKTDDRQPFIEKKIDQSLNIEMPFVLKK